MAKNHFILAFLFMIPWIVSGQVHIPQGPVSGTFQASQSPYYIDGDVEVPGDSILVVEPGVDIFFSDAYSFMVRGRLLAIGTADSVITWQPIQGDWKGITFRDIDLTSQDTSRLEFCDISGCNEYNGGALEFQNAGRVILTECIIHDNLAVNGGAAFFRFSDVTFNSCTIHTNRALDGAGIYAHISNPVFNDCWFHHNNADAAGGAGLFANCDLVTLDGCLVEDNSSNGSGGAFYAKYVDQLIVNECVFKRNELFAVSGLPNGGALSIKDSCLSVITNSIFEENIAGTSGGAISTFSESHILNCLFKGNSAGFGGAIDIWGLSNTGSIIANCTFTENQALQGTSIMVDRSGALLANSILWEEDTTSMVHLGSESPFLAELEIEYSGIRGGQSSITATFPSSLVWGDGNINQDPLFVDAGNHDFRLSWESPCIEAGNPDTAVYDLPPTDLEGNPRVVNAIVDMGCYEYQYPVSIREEKKISVKAWPVPCRGILHIQSQRLDYYNIIVADIYGRILIEDESDSVNHELNLLEFPSGNYLVTIWSAKGKETAIVPLLK
jgi:predicted outer membrane repeat protein